MMNQSTATGLCHHDDGSVSHSTPGLSHPHQFTATGSCHPDDGSVSDGRKDLGQLRVSEAGSGFLVGPLRAHLKSQQTNLESRYNTY